MKTPIKHLRAASPAPISAALRAAILGRGISGRQVAIASGLNDRIVQRFLAESRGLTLKSAELLFSALGLRAVEAPGRRKKLGAHSPDRQELEARETPSAAAEPFEDSAIQDPEQK